MRALFSAQDTQCKRDFPGHLRSNFETKGTTSAQIGSVYLGYETPSKDSIFLTEETGTT
jgi:hypothetical protein